MTPTRSAEGCGLFFSLARRRLRSDLNSCQPKFERGAAKMTELHKWFSVVLGGVTWSNRHRWQLGSSGCT